MASLGQFLVFLFIYLLSLAFFIFVRRRLGDGGDDGTDVEAAPMSQAETASRADTLQASRSTATIQCGVCGVENDTDFTYCKNCIADLDSAQPRSVMV